MVLMMKRKCLGVLLITLLLFIFLALSFVKSSIAVPTTRSLMINLAGNPSPSVLQHGLPSQGATVMKLSDDVVITEGRMVVESLDYPGTGANNHHDPKTPGRS
ncbi:unnamed protein product [Linum tenue]|uniref:Uncharacterized protein n=1 Tax=Linum tenue TaxID=586396 RepID=A0AAV0ISP5_9ROSI|nr:unnamed protein product [Linum tenue]